MHGCAVDVIWEACGGVLLWVCGCGERLVTVTHQRVMPLHFKEMMCRSERPRGVQTHIFIGGNGVQHWLDADRKGPEHRAVPAISDPLIDAWLRKGKKMGP